MRAHVQAAGCPRSRNALNRGPGDPSAAHSQPPSRFQQTIAFASLHHRSMSVRLLPAMLPALSSLDKPSDSSSFSACLLPLPPDRLHRAARPTLPVQQPPGPLERVQQRALCLFRLLHRPVVRPNRHAVGDWRRQLARVPFIPGRLVLADALSAHRLESARSYAGVSSPVIALDVGPPAFGTQPGLGPCQQLQPWPASGDAAGLRRLVDDQIGRIPIRLHLVHTQGALFCDRKCTQDRVLIDRSALSVCRQTRLRASPRSRLRCWASCRRKDSTTHASSLETWYDVTRENGVFTCPLCERTNVSSDYLRKHIKGASKHGAEQLAVLPSLPANWTVTIKMPPAVTPLKRKLSAPSVSTPGRRSSASFQALRAPDSRHASPDVVKVMPFDEGRQPAPAHSPLPHVLNLTRWSSCPSLTACHRPTHS